MSKQHAASFEDVHPSYASCRQLSSEVRRRKFPRCLLVVGATQRRHHMMVELTRRGFVVEDTDQLKVALGRWRYPQFHDCIIIDFDLMGDLSGLFLAQEMRKLDRQSSFSSDSIAQRRSMMKHLLEERGDTITKEELFKNVAGKKSRLIGFCDDQEQYTHMEHAKCFDVLLRHPFDLHAAQLQEIFVSLEEMPKLTAPQTPSQLLTSLGNIHLQRLPGDVVDQLIYGNNKGSSGGTLSRDGIPTTFNAATFVQLQSQLRAAVEQLKLFQDGLTESERETSEAQKSAQNLRLQVDQLRDERESLLSNVSALEALMKEKAEQMAGQRRDFEALGGIAKQTPENLMGDPSFRTGDSLVVDDFKFQVDDAKHLVDENQRLRDAFFSLQSEQYLLKGELSAIQSKYNRMKQRLAEDSERNPGRSDTITTLISPVGKNNIGHIVQNAEATLQYHDARSGAEMSNKTNSKFAATQSFVAFPTGEEEALERTDSEIQQEPGSPGSPRGIQRFRHSILQVRKSIRLSKQILGSPTMFNTTNAGQGRRKHKINENVLSRYEMRMMEMQDEISHIRVRENFFTQGLLPQQSVVPAPQPTETEPTNRAQSPSDSSGAKKVSQQRAEHLLSDSFVKKEWYQTEAAVEALEKTVRKFLHAPLAAILTPGEEGSTAGDLQPQQIMVLSAALRSYMRSKKSSNTVEEERQLEELFHAIFQPFKVFLEKMLHQYKSLLLEMQRESVQLLEKEQFVVAHQLLPSLEECNQRCLTQLIESIVAAAATEQLSGLPYNQRLKEQQALEATLRATFSNVPSLSGTLSNTVVVAGSLDNTMTNASFASARSDARSRIRSTTAANTNTAPLEGLQKEYKEALQRIMQHLHGHYHQLIRRGLKSTLQIHLQAMQGFQPAMLNGVNLIERHLYPLQLQLRKARDMGRLRQQCEFSTQTNPVMVREVGEAEEVKNEGGMEPSPSLSILSSRTQRSHERAKSLFFSDSGAMGGGRNNRLQSVAFKGFGSGFFSKTAREKQQRETPSKSADISPMDTGDLVSMNEENNS